MAFPNQPNNNINLNNLESIPISQSMVSPNINQQQQQNNYHSRNNSIPQNNNPFGANNNSNS